MASGTINSAVWTPLEYVRASLVGGMSSVISVYQRRISPHKGFSCAYRVSKKRSSCSAFGKRALLKAGLLLFIPLLFRRFRKCSHTAAALKGAKPHVLDHEPKSQKRQRPLYERLGCTWENCADVGCNGGAEMLSEGACQGAGCLAEAICSGP
jgi:putative component of membrane protein insertase Oxa1/YidC/SpoIIIJ protein YidD